MHECVLGQPTTSVAPFGFSLRQNHKITNLFCVDNDEYMKFMTILRLKCILLTWEEDFEIVKTMGRGSFANVNFNLKQVYMVRNRHNNVLLAAKRLSKNILQNDIKGLVKKTLN